MLSSSFIFYPGFIIKKALTKVYLFYLTHSLCVNILPFPSCLSIIKENKLQGSEYILKTIF